MIQVAPYLPDRRIAAVQARGQPYRIQRIPSDGIAYAPSPVASPAASPMASPLAAPRAAMAAAAAALAAAAAPQALAAARPQPQQLYRSEEPMVLVVGSQVDYWSPSYETWMPANVVHTDPETGLVELDVKPKQLLRVGPGSGLSPTSADIQCARLRPRARPSPAQLARMHELLREGCVQDKVQGIFNRHAIIQIVSGKDEPRTPLLREGAVKALGQELDALLGVSGAAVWLKFQIQQAGGALTADAFTSILCRRVWAVYAEYGEAVDLGFNAAPCRRYDPQRDYHLDKVLGKGTYGAVYLARQRGNKASRRAIKQIGKTASGMTPAELEQEINHLCALDHPHIVKLYEYYETSEYIHLVMDFCPGGDLQGILDNHARPSNRHLSEGFTVQVLQQVLKAIAHVHGRGIMHLDLKSANVMLMPAHEETLPPAGGYETRNGECHAAAYFSPSGGRPHVMVIDLGVAQLFQAGDRRFKQPVGTPATMAPEVWIGEQTPKADIWSMGVILFELLSNKLPFTCPCVHEQARHYWGFGQYGVYSRTPEAPWGQLSHASPSALSLCRRMLTRSRQQRPTAAECLNAYFLNGGAGERGVAPPGADAGAGGSRAGTPMHRCRSASRGTVAGSILERLAESRKRTALQWSVSLQIARRWPANQLPSIKRAFDALDGAGNGRLDKAQFLTALTSLGVNQAVAREIAEAVDLNRDGAVEWSEFVAACIRPGEKALEEDLRQIFDVADSDGDGYLTREDLATLLAAEHLRGHVAAGDALHGLLDCDDEDATVDWSAFRRYFSISGVAGQGSPGGRPRVLNSPRGDNSAWEGLLRILGGPLLDWGSPEEQLPRGGSFHLPAGQRTPRGSVGTPREGGSVVVAAAGQQSPALPPRPRPRASMGSPGPAQRQHADRPGQVSARSPSPARNLAGLPPKAPFCAAAQQVQEQVSAIVHKASGVL